MEIKVSFPHMGNSYIAFRGLVEALGCTPVIPDRPNSRTVKEGSKVSPEAICFPFKINMGDFLNAFEKGTQVLVMVTGVGPCRFGYYGELQEKILRSMGYDFEIYIINQNSIVDIIKRLQEMLGYKGFYRKFWRALRTLVNKSKTIHMIERMARESRCYEVNKGETTKVMKKCLQMVDQAKTFREMKRARKKAAQMFREIPVDKTRNPIKVAILGEIYVVVESNINFNIEELLGDMGVFVFQPSGLYEWLKHLVRLDSTAKKAVALAKPYLKYTTGAKDQYTIGYTIKCSQEGYDGVIHLYPFTCMPQTMARTILDTVSRDYNIPVLNISLDEHSGEAGFLTRVEAFIDLLERRRAQKMEEASLLEARAI